MRTLFKLLCIAAVSIRCEAAANYDAVDASRAEVQIAYDLASDGDTITIPAGTAVWTNKLTVSKMVTIQGAGTNSTILIDEVPNSVRVGTSGTLFTMLPRTLTGTMRLTGIQFRGGTTNALYAGSGIIKVQATDNLNGTNSQWRIDNCFWSNAHGRFVGCYAWTGCIDHNTVTLPIGQAGMSFDGRVADSNEKGHVSWASDILMGTVNEGVYLEYNRFINPSTQARAITDGFAGARYVIRFNTGLNVLYENHGTESAQIFRGTRWMSVYGNTNTSTIATADAFAYYRSGSGMVFSNTLSGTFLGVGHLVDYRLNQGWVPYLQSNGTNGWDFNNTTGGPLGDGVFEHGTHTGASHVETLVDNTKNWGTNNYWVGYSVVNLNASAGTSSTYPTGGRVISSTSNSITVFKQDGPGGFHCYFTNGEPYQIRKVIYGLDMPGMGKCDLLTGGTGTVGGNPDPYGWPNQVVTPIYFLYNTGYTNVSSAGYYPIVAGTHYIVTTNFPPGFALLPTPHPYASGATLVYPTISAITNRTIAHDANTGAIPITIGAGTTTVANYTMSGGTSSTTLVPLANIVFGGSGASRTVTVTPAAGQSGTVTITATVADEAGLRASTSFVLTVTGSGNNAPTITAIANQTISLSGSTPALAFTIGDVETAAASLIVTTASSDTTCIPAAAVQIGGSGASQTVTVSPSLNYGASIITLTVSDGSASTSTSFTVSCPAPAGPAYLRTTNFNVQNLYRGP